MYMARILSHHRYFEMISCVGQLNHWAMPNIYCDSTCCALPPVARGLITTTPWGHFAPIPLHSSSPIKTILDCEHCRTLGTTSIDLMQEASTLMMSGRLMLALI